MNCWNTTSAQYPTAHLNIIVSLPWPRHQHQRTVRSEPIPARRYGVETRSCSPRSAARVRLSGQRSAVPLPSHTRPAFSKCLRNMARAIRPPMMAPTTEPETAPPAFQWRRGLQGVHIVRRHPLLRDLPQEVLPHEPDGQRRSHHAHREECKRIPGCRRCSGSG